MSTKKERAVMTGPQKLVARHGEMVAAQAAANAHFGGKYDDFTVVTYTDGETAVRCGYTYDNNGVQVQTCTMVYRATPAGVYAARRWEKAQRRYLAQGARLFG